jgi:hypothetical protein
VLHALPISSSLISLSSTPYSLDTDW